MYTPRHFRDGELQSAQATMRAHPFALLITPHASRLELSWIPLRLDARRGAYGTLEGHLARANPHAEALRAGAPTVAAFLGPHAYVSPRWYQDPTENVPTWNYTAVMAHGRPRPIEQHDELLALIGRLTDEHEAGRARPWRVDEARVHAEHVVDHVVGFELEISALESKRKLSQNRAAADRKGVMDALAQDPRHADLLDAMRALFDADGAAR